MYVASCNSNCIFKTSIFLEGGLQFSWDLALFSAPQISRIVKTDRFSSLMSQYIDQVIEIHRPNLPFRFQIFICYSNTYYETDKCNRDLAKSYSFQCRCVACEENWPSFQYLQSVYDIRFCECEHHNALYRRISITGCSFCRFKHDLALSLRTIRDRLASGRPFLSIVENLRLDIVEAMDLFQSLEGIEVHLIKEYVELYRLFCQCIEIAGNMTFNQIVVLEPEKLSWRHLRC